MSLRGSVQQMRESFDAQFEAADGGRLLYRRNQKGEPIPVSTAERERFVQQYVRRVWLILGGMMIGLLAFTGIVIWRTVATNSELPDLLIYIGTAAIAVVGIGLMYWVRGAPARELIGRTPIGRERTRDEMRKLMLQKMSYGQLAAVAFAGAILPFTLRSQGDILHGWGRLWLAFGAALVLLAGIQAFRKWRLDREQQR